MGSSGPDPLDPVATFQAVIDRYLAAYSAHDAVGCAALYAENAEVRSPFGPVARGRAEIEAEHLRWFADGETNKTMQVTRAGIDGDLGYCLVVFAADVPRAGGAVERVRGSSLNVLERRTDGIWTITLTSLNEAVEQGTDQDT